MMNSPILIKWVLEGVLPFAYVLFVEKAVTKANTGLCPLPSDGALFWLLLLTLPPFNINHSLFLQFHLHSIIVLALHSFIPSYGFTVKLNYETTWKINSS